MELYDDVSYELSQHLTQRYSSSFSVSSRLFSSEIRHHIYAVYGLVRLADEIVDSYRGSDAGEQLDRLEHTTYAALAHGYDSNPIVHAFILTARKFAIDESLLRPFFASMRYDLAPHTYTDASYREYIHGSAEVVGLMCLRVFTYGDAAMYEQLKDGAAALGAAYQKINFLRDIASDYKALGRVYFPGVQFERFDASEKQAIITDIRSDFEQAASAIHSLPESSKKAVTLSYLYYQKLLDVLERTPMERLKTERVRVPDYIKLWIATKVRMGYTKI